MDDLPIGAFDQDDDLVAATRQSRVGQSTVRAFEGVAVVLGRGSDPARELHLEAVRDEGVSVLRRPGGGCAVVLDPGNVIVSVALPTRDFRNNQGWFDAITRWFIQGLAATGVTNVTHDGISDLVLDGRKIAGSCIHRTRDVLYYSASLLVRPDIERVTRLLCHPPREPAYRRGRSHAEFMGSLAAIPAAEDVCVFARSLDSALRVKDIVHPARQPLRGLAQDGTLLRRRKSEEKKRGFAAEEKLP